MVKLIGKILVPALLVGTAAIQSFGIDMGRVSRSVKLQDSLFLTEVDSTALSPADTTISLGDSIASADDTAAFLFPADTSITAGTDSTATISPRDTIVVPDSLRETDPLKFKYFIALRDSVTRIETRDSLLAAEDTIELMKFDSLYFKDSSEVAQAKFNAWYNSLTKRERKKYDYEQQLPARMAAAMAKLERADSIRAAKDSIIEVTPRILETYAVPDSMQYKRMITWTHDRDFNNVRLFEYDTTYNYHFNDSPVFKKLY